MANDQLADTGAVMAQDGLSWAPLVSALSAAALAISVFMPWYGVTLTQSGADSAQQGLESVARQYGNTTLQTDATSVSEHFGSLAGHQLGTVSAHEILKDLNVVLLLLAGIGLGAALLKLAGAEIGTGQIALVGLLAGLCVAFRMIDPPAPQEGVFALPLAWGIWMALAASATMIVSDLWPRLTRRDEPSAAALAQALEGPSGWTPES
jgi:hypothetical protein